MLFHFNFLRLRRLDILSFWGGGGGGLPFRIGGGGVSYIFGSGNFVKAYVFWIQFSACSSLYFWVLPWLKTYIFGQI